MIRGITKPISPETALITDKERRTAAGLYIASMDALFAKFDPQIMGDSNLPLVVPFEKKHDGIHAVATRETQWLEVWAPDTQWHSYILKNNQAAVWRDDGIMVNSLRRPKAERTLPANATAFEALENLKRIAAEREALHLHEPTGMFVDAEEVTKLFELLMQGEVDREIL
ncbi:MAG TPA: hypothetical protein VLG11_02430 [Candidatus Saccharimonadales bacterium]|nr:hypothetical protein [Candidatus Saccharimonadales bacterium]